jgi:hypothetical protein
MRKMHKHRQSGLRHAGTRTLVGLKKVNGVVPEGLPAGDHPFT